MITGAKCSGTFNHDEAVTLEFRLVVKTKSGQLIHEIEGEHDIVGLLAPRAIGHMLRDFQKEWRTWVEGPLFAGLDAHRRELSERARQNGPLVDYPTEIDLMDDAASIGSGALFDQAEYDGVVRQRAQALRDSHPV